MVYCHECNMELDGTPLNCYICGSALNPDVDPDWVTIGTVENRMYADFVRETLKACRIPVIVISRSGFFGNVGLPLHPFYHPQIGSFEIKVPIMHRKEAVETLDMTIGDRWLRKE